MLNDNFGRYVVTFRYKEPDNNKNYEFRKYVNSTKIKKFGGMFALYCEEDNQIIFRRNEYLRDKSYKKFSEGRCDDFINVDSRDSSLDTSVESNYYTLPGKIDKSKLTKDEFNTLRELIRKSLIH